MKSLVLPVLAALGLLGASAPVQVVIAHLEMHRHGGGTVVSSVMISGDYAVARGHVGSKLFHDGLRESAGGWHAVCSLGAAAADPQALQNRCGFPIAAAVPLAADEAANAAAA